MLSSLFGLSVLIAPALAGAPYFSFDSGRFFVNGSASCTTDAISDGGFQSAESSTSAAVGVSAMCDDERFGEGFWDSGGNFNPGLLEGVFYGDALEQTSATAGKGFGLSAVLQGSFSYIADNLRGVVGYSGSAYTDNFMFWDVVDPYGRDGILEVSGFATISSKENMAEGFVDIPGYTSFYFSHDRIWGSRVAKNTNYNPDAICECSDTSVAEVIGDPQGDVAHDDVCSPFVGVLFDTGWDTAVNVTYNGFIAVGDQAIAAAYGISHYGYDEGSTGDRVYGDQSTLTIHADLVGEPTEVTPRECVENDSSDGGSKSDGGYGSDGGSKSDGGYSSDEGSKSDGGYSSDEGSKSDWGYGDGGYYW